MCTCPNYMVWNGQYTNDDKPKLLFIGHHQYNKMLEVQSLPFIQVPCGKCLECRIQHARSWADRCVLEAKKSPDRNYFITLTYDDDHLPERNSLDPDDMTKFIKRLRKHFKDVKIKYFYCGEYGDKSFRPHYHILLFNCPLNDLSYNFQVYDGERYINHLRPENKGDLLFSRLIYDLWQNPKKGHLGMISVARFNYDTAAYVSQYVTKKCNPNNDRLYKELNIYPEFLRMSKGLGADYFHQHDDIHYTGHVIVPCDGEAHIVSVPRYFDKLFIKKYGDDVFDPIRIKRLKKRFERENTYLSGNKTFDKDNDVRNYRLNKMKRDRTSI